jgi:Cdc6-like AAA superfamily ATPase
MPTPINKALMRLSKRAESQDRLTLVETFVDVGPLSTLLSRNDHQVIYGRRGIGKTHALSYLAEKRNEAGDCVV